MPRLATQAGADLGGVRIRVEGGESVALDDEMLRLSTGVGVVAWSLLQMEGLTSKAAVHRQGTLAFDVTAPFAMAQSDEDLATAQSIARFGHLEGVAPATSDNPHRNLMNAPYWTAGGRTVILLSNEPVALEDIRFFDWAWGRVRWVPENERGEQATEQSGPSE